MGRRPSAHQRSCAPGVLPAPQKDPETALAKVDVLIPVASSLGCSLPQLAVAWCLKNANVSTVILGASKVEQVTENLAAVEVQVDDEESLTVDPRDHHELAPFLEVSRAIVADAGKEGLVLEAIPAEVPAWVDKDIQGGTAVVSMGVPSGRRSLMKMASESSCGNRMTERLARAYSKVPKKPPTNRMPTSPARGSTRRSTRAYTPSRRTSHAGLGRRSSRRPTR